jgi:hypothetical protein
MRFPILPILLLALTACQGASVPVTKPISEHKPVPETKPIPDPKPVPVKAPISGTVSMGLSINPYFSLDCPPPLPTSTKRLLVGFTQPLGSPRRFLYFNVSSG